ncbi:MAG: hypothetical protein JOZ47_09415 [Kutzneria sp.]|nr:hypothetical protein [Kutzneria sp.]
MITILYPTCAAVSWSAALYKIRALRGRPRDHAGCALATSLVALGLIFMVATPVVWGAIDRFTGIVNLSTLLSQGCVVVFGACEQVLLLLWLWPPDRAWRKARTRLLVAGAALVTITVLFAASATTDEQTSDFVVNHAGEPYYACYLAVFVTAFAVSQVEVVRLCRRYRKAVASPWLRRGLSLAGTGAALGLVYCAARYADVVLVRFGLDAASWEVLARLGAGVGAILNTIGWTIPSWGPALGWVGRWRHYRRLYPLWAALYRVTPAIVLDPDSDRRGLRDIRFRLYRRTIEIRDGQLALRPYLDPDVARLATRHATAAGLDGDRLRATVQATQLAVALRAKEAGRSPAQAADPVDHRGTDLAEEIDWLVMVSMAFTSSPVVTTVLDEVP